MKVQEFHMEEHAKHDLKVYDDSKAFKEKLE